MANTSHVINYYKPNQNSIDADPVMGTFQIVYSKRWRPGSLERVVSTIQSKAGALSGASKEAVIQLSDRLIQKKSPLTNEDKKALLIMIKHITGMELELDHLPAFLETVKKVPLSKWEAILQVGQGLLREAFNPISYFAIVSALGSLEDDAERAMVSKAVKAVRERDVIARVFGRELALSCESMICRFKERFSSLSKPDRQRFASAVEVIGSGVVLGQETLFDFLCSTTDLECLEIVAPYAKGLRTGDIIISIIKSAAKVENKKEVLKCASDLASKIEQTLSCGIITISTKLIGNEEAKVGFCHFLEGVGNKYEIVDLLNTLPKEKLLHLLTIKEKIPQDFKRVIFELIEPIPIAHYEETIRHLSRFITVNNPFVLNVHRSIIGEIPKEMLLEFLQRASQFYPEEDLDDAYRLLVLNILKSLPADRVSAFCEEMQLKLKDLHSSDRLLELAVLKHYPFQECDLLLNRLLTLFPATPSEVDRQNKLVLAGLFFNNGPQFFESMELLFKGIEEPIKRLYLMVLVATDSEYLLEERLEIYQSLIGDTTDPDQIREIATSLLYFHGNIRDLKVVAPLMKSVKDAHLKASIFLLKKDEHESEYFLQFTNTILKMVGDSTEYDPFFKELTEIKDGKCLEMLEVIKPLINQITSSEVCRRVFSELQGFDPGECKKLVEEVVLRMPGKTDAQILLLVKQVKAFDRVKILSTNEALRKRFEDWIYSTTSALDELCSAIKVCFNVPHFTKVEPPQSTSGIGRGMYLMLNLWFERINLVQEARSLFLELCEDLTFTGSVDVVSYFDAHPGLLNSTFLRDAVNYTRGIAGGKQLVALLKSVGKFPAEELKIIKEIVLVSSTPDSVVSEVKKLFPNNIGAFQVLHAEVLVQEDKDIEKRKSLIALFLAEPDRYFPLIFNRRTLLIYMIKYHFSEVQKAIVDKKYSEEMQCHLIPFLNPSQIVALVDGLSEPLVQKLLNEMVVDTNRIWPSPKAALSELRGKREELLLTELGYEGMIQKIPFGALSLIAKTEPELLLPHIFLMDDLQLAAILPFLDPKKVLELAASSISKYTFLAKRAPLALKIELLRGVKFPVETNPSSLQMFRQQFLQLEGHCRKGDTSPELENFLEDLKIKTETLVAPVEKEEAGDPEEFLDIITKERMVNPIKLPDCEGHIDRSTFERWCQQHQALGQDTIPHPIYANRRPRYKISSFKADPQLQQKIKGATK